MMDGVGSTMADYGVTDCPHKPGSPEHTAWMRTWLDQASVDRLADGTTGANTQRMKALANADFTAAGYGRPDPVVELLGPYDPLTVDPVFKAGPTVMVSMQIVVDFETFAEQLRQAGRAIVEALTPISNHIATVFEALAPQPGCDPAVEQVRALARKRHGIAAQCPRHGPTRGGTCLTCARGRR